MSPSQTTCGLRHAVGLLRRTEGGEGGIRTGWKPHLIISVPLARYFTFSLSICLIYYSPIIRRGFFTLISAKLKTPLTKRFLFFGEGGIRTLDTDLNPYNRLATCRFQPLSHLSSSITN